MIVCVAIRKISPQFLSNILLLTGCLILHRTVSDFLRGPEMTALLSKHVGKDFHARTRITKANQMIFSPFEYLN